MLQMLEQFFHSVIKTIGLIMGAHGSHAFIGELGCAFIVLLPVVIRW